MFVQVSKITEPSVNLARDSVLDSLRLFEELGRFFRVGYKDLDTRAGLADLQPRPSFAHPKMTRQTERGQAVPCETVYKGQQMTLLPQALQVAAAPAMPQEGYGQRATVSAAHAHLGGRGLRLETPAELAHMRIGAAAAITGIDVQREQTRQSAAPLQSVDPPRNAFGENAANPAVRSIGTDMTAPLKERYILTERSERETITEQKSPPLPATPPGYIDYDTIYRHVERCLSEVVACSRAGF